MIYSFGDSIVAGHVYPKGFVDEVADKLHLDHKKYARNGAAVLKFPIMGGQIIEQVQKADSQAPDVILFNGGTNDADFLENNPQVSIENHSDKKLDGQTFEGEFENLIQAMQEKWPRVPVVYVAVHKMGSREAKIQEALHNVEMKICQKHHVYVVDLYADSALNTNDKKMQANYTFDGLNKKGMPGDNGSGTHPNWRAVEEFYVPPVSKIIEEILMY